MKKLMILLLAAALLLAGCGSKASDTMNAVPEAEEKYEAIYDEAGGTNGSTDASTAFADQKLVKTVELNAETEDLDALLAVLTGHIRELGGYTEYQNVYNGSAYASHRRRSAELTVRVPADRLDSFVAHMEGESNVISKTESVDDVTMQYVDTESRVEALQAEHDRLVELMDKAETMSDLLEIENRMTQVRYELESYASRLRVLQNQVSYATIKLWISEVEVLTEVDEQTMWQRMGSGFTENLRNLGEDIQNFCVWVVTYSPQLIIFAGLIALAVTLVRRTVRKRAKKRTPPTEETQA